MPESSGRFDSVTYPIVSQPGIKRDGTELDGNFYADSNWVRFRLGRPKKMGGFREIQNGLDGPIRHMYIHSKHPEHIIYNFSGTGIQCVLVDNEAVGGSSYTRSMPAFTTGDNYLYQTDTLFDVTGGNTSIIVHPGRNLSDMDQSTATTVYFGDVLGTGALSSTGQTVDGGIVVLQPYLFIYGTNGLIKNSAANKPNDFATGDSNTANVAGTKIVRGLPLRGGGQAPSGLFWSLDSLIRVSFVGGTAKWKYDTVSAKTTVLCSNGFIDYDGVFFWPGVDRFLMYNGVIKEVPNQMNQDFFFDNLNWNARQKVWVTAQPRWGEIWWHFPKGQSTECNHAIVYNVRENTWYDTPIERSAGYAPRVLYFPVYAESTSNDDSATPDKYRIFRHEVGTDKVVGEQQLSIDAFVETAAMGFASGGPGGNAIPQPNVQTRVLRIEPDFVMNGDMTVQLRGQAHAQAPVVVDAEKPFGPTTPTVDFNTQRRLLRIRFRSNMVGGDFHMGKTIVHMEPGDPRQ